LFLSGFGIESLPISSTTTTEKPMALIVEMFAAVEALPEGLMISLNL
jgi:hypothetical protein